MVFIKDWRILEAKVETIIFFQKTFERKTVNEKNQSAFSNWLCTVRYSYSGGSGRTNCSGGFPPIFWITNICRQDIGPLIQEYNDGKGIMYQLRRKLFSSFDLKNGTISTPLLFFNWIRIWYAQKFSVLFSTLLWDEMTQQFQTTCCWCSTATRGKFQN